ncbi:class I SAM-dependent methyltransferase [Nocardioides sediminis]|uniref:class I SAM-dependent methyltransferase n=1 Tax=Nocardioides sediminis TaxID=433648 RepID=UPI00131F08EE|nr:methyltransferase domain-containing protein [Nocardioides sediminis]
MHDQSPISDPARIVDDYYASHYAAVHGSGCVGGAASLLHRRLERRRGPDDYFPVTVEVGAGRFEHYPLVRHRRDRYIATDIRIPGQHSHQRAIGSRTRPGDLEFVQTDAMHLALGDAVVDRLVASCLLIHLPDPWAAVKEWQRVCRPDGVIDMLVPCDPGMVSRAFRRLVSRPAARKRGVPAGVYELVNAIEHVSPFGRVITLARAAVDPGRRLDVDYFPIPVLPSWNLNAFAVLSIGPE